LPLASTAADQVNPRAADFASHGFAETIAVCRLPSAVCRLPSAACPTAAPASDRSSAARNRSGRPETTTLSRSTWSASTVWRSHFSSCLGTPLSHRPRIGRRATPIHRHSSQT
jgi:hypothetical protein